MRFARELVLFGFEDSLVKGQCAGDKESNS